MSTPKTGNPEVSARRPVWVNGIKCVSKAQVERATLVALRLEPVTVAEATAILLALASPATSLPSSRESGT